MIWAKNPCICTQVGGQACALQILWMIFPVATSIFTSLSNGRIRVYLRGGVFSQVNLPGVKIAMSSIGKWAAIRRISSCIPASCA